MHKKFSLTVFSLLLIIYCLPLTTSVFAQTYVFEGAGHNRADNPQTVTISDDSTYIYGYLSAGSDTTDYYNLNFTQYTSQVPLRLLIRDSSDASFRPSLIYTDPGLSQMFGTVPFGFPDTLGGRVYPWQSVNEGPYTDVTFGLHFLEGPTIMKDFAARSYLIGIYDPSGRGGRYVIAVGNTNKKVGLFDLLSKLGSYLRIQFSLY